MNTAQRIKWILRAKLQAVMDGSGEPPAPEEEGCPEREDRSTSTRAANNNDVKEAECLAILELSSGAAKEQIKAAYKRLCNRYHPDRFTGDAAKERMATELLTEINAAYNHLVKRVE